MLTQDLMLGCYVIAADQLSLGNNVMLYALDIHNVMLNVYRKCPIFSWFHTISHEIESFLTNFSRNSSRNRRFLSKSKILGKRWNNSIISQ